MKRLKKIVSRTLRSATTGLTKSEQRLGDDARARGDWAQAAKHYGMHVARNRADFGIWVQLGHALKEAGRYDDAEAAYQSAHRLDDVNADLFLSRGHLAKIRGDKPTAIDFYNRSFQIDANPHAAHELTLANKAAPLLNLTTTEDTLNCIGALEALADGILVGWVADMENNGRPIEVEVLLNGEVIATPAGVIERPDLKKAGLTRGPAGFRLDLGGILDLTQEPELSARVRETGQTLIGSPLTARPSPQALKWSQRHSELGSNALAALKRRIANEGNNGRLSVIVSTIGAKRAALTDLVESLANQWSENWELICVHQTGIDSKSDKALSAQAKKDARIRVLPPISADLVGQLNEGLRAATGETLLLMRADSVLEPEAVYSILNAARAGAELIYWDEAVVGSNKGSIERFITRPAYSSDWFNHSPSLIGPFAIQSRLNGQLGGLNASQQGGLDLDFLLRAVEASSTIAHIPGALMRTRERSVAEAPEAQDKIQNQKVVTAHWKKTAPDWSIESGTSSNTWRSSAPEAGGRCLIILTATDRVEDLNRSVHAVLKSTFRRHADLLVISDASAPEKVTAYLDKMANHLTVWPSHTGSSRAQSINDAVASHGADYEDLALVGVGVTPKHSDWLEPLCARLQRADVGAVGPLLVNRQGLVEGAGIIFDRNQLIRSHHGIPLMAGAQRSLGWQNSLVALHAKSATDQCLVLRRALFEDAGGLDPSIEAGLEDADLCLRLDERGYAILIDPDVVVRSTDLEPALSVSGQFALRWSHRLASTDPYDSPVRDSHERLAKGLLWPARLRPAGLHKALHPVQWPSLTPPAEVFDPSRAPS